MALYSFTGTCADFDSGMEVYEIVEQDDMTYSDETFNHNPEHQISEKEFRQLTDSERAFDFYGWNKDLNIVFGYDYSMDMHYFFTE